MILCIVLTARQTACRQVREADHGVCQVDLSLV